MADVVCLTLAAHRRRPPPTVSINTYHSPSEAAACWASRASLPPVSHGGLCRSVRAPRNRADLREIQRVGAPGRPSLYRLSAYLNGDSGCCGSRVQAQLASTAVLGCACNHCRIAGWCRSSDCSGHGACSAIWGGLVTYGEFVVISGLLSRLGFQ